MNAMGYSTSVHELIVSNIKNTDLNTVTTDRPEVGKQC